MEVRSVDPGDADLCRRLGEIVLSAYVTLPGHVDEPDYEAELADVAGRAGLPETIVLGAFDGGAPLGCVTYVASSTSPMAEDVAEGDASFRMLGVDPATQGRGVGRTLVEWCIGRARSDGRLGLAMHTTVWMTGAHRLYEKLGFARDPARDWEPVPGIQLLGYRLDLSGRCPRRARRASPNSARFAGPSTAKRARFGLPRQARAVDRRGSGSNDRARGVRIGRPRPDRSGQWPTSPSPG